MDWPACFRLSLDSVRLQTFVVKASVSLAYALASFPAQAFPVDLSVEADYARNIRKMVGLAPAKVSGQLLLGATVIQLFTAEPNQVYTFSGGALNRGESAPFKPKTDSLLEPIVARYRGQQID